MALRRVTKKAPRRQGEGPSRAAREGKVPRSSGEYEGEEDEARDAHAGYQNRLYLLVAHFEVSAGHVLAPTMPSG